MTHRCTLLLLLCFLLARPVTAQGVAAPPAAPSAEARASQTHVEERIDPRAEYHKGNAAFRDGRFTAARFHYRRSVEAELSFDAMCNWGRTEAEMGDDVAAYEHLTKCLEIHPDDAALIDSRARFSQLLQTVRDRMTVEQRELSERRLAAFPLETSAPAYSDAYSESVLTEPTYSPARTVVSVAAASAALLGLGVATGLFIYSEDQGAEAADLRAAIEADGGSCVGASADPACSELASHLRTSDDTFNASMVTFAVSGGVLAGAVVAYLLWPKSKAGSSSAAVARPTWGPFLAGSRSAAGQQVRRNSDNRSGLALTPVLRVPFNGGGYVGLSGRF